MRFHRAAARFALPAALAAAVCGVLEAAGPGTPGSSEAAFKRGKLLFGVHCALCHQASGRGAAGVYPPLAGSDFLRERPDEAILAVVAGLARPITVLGKPYQGRMPAIVLDDAQAADVLTYVRQAWGNDGGPVAPADVGRVRATSAFPTFEALAAANRFPDPPKAPPGFALREVARLPDFATRMAGDGRGDRVYVLGQSGTVWRLDLGAGRLTQILARANYANLPPEEATTLGMTLGPDGRLWITMNQRIESSPLATNVVSIYRTAGRSPEGDPIAPELWFRSGYPQGIGPYNHGISDIKFGPDGMLYVSSGSRTDGGEAGDAPNLGKMGEVDLTSCLWRLNPAAASPAVEVVARGVRNAYSFRWDGEGRLFTVSNGPDAHAPEEMDLITPPGPGMAPEHHGFPYQFGEVPAGAKWYPHTPEAPAGVKFVLPVINLGPAGVLEGKPTSTFTPHSSPAGLVWLGDDWPRPWGGRFLMGRFGNLIPGAGGDDAGFDLLSLQLERRADGRWITRTETVLSPLGRPIDLYLAPGRRVLVLEYTRATDFKSQSGMLPGRILELAWKGEPPR